MALDVLGRAGSRRFVFCPFVYNPGSPRWLAINGKKQAAKKVFTHIGGSEYAQNALADMQIVSGAESQVNWRALMQPGVRKVLIIGVVLAVFQQWCGINVIFNYAHEIFSAAGYAVSDVLMNIVVTGVTNLILVWH